MLVLSDSVGVARMEILSASPGLQADSQTSEDMISRRNNGLFMISNEVISVLTCGGEIIPLNYLYGLFIVIGTLNAGGIRSGRGGFSRCAAIG